jgi:hypothetical protein
MLLTRTSDIEDLLTGDCIEKAILVTPFIRSARSVVKSSNQIFTARVPSAFGFAEPLPWLVLLSALQDRSLKASTFREMPRRAGRLNKARTKLLYCRPRPALLRHSCRSAQIDLSADHGPYGSKLRRVKAERASEAP